jgi:hypothetical protein
MKSNIEQTREVMNQKLSNRLMTSVRREKLATILSLFNKALDVPKGCNTSMSLMTDQTNQKQIVQFTFEIPLEDVIPLIQKWNGWKNAYKHRKR